MKKPLVFRIDPILMAILIATAVSASLLMIGAALWYLTS